MKRSFKGFISVLAVLCLVFSLSVTAFAANNGTQFTDSGDITFTFGGSDVSLSKAMDVSRLNRTSLADISTSFSDVAEEGNLEVISEFTGSSAHFTIYDQNFSSVFLVKSSKGLKSYVDLAVLAASTEEISYVTLYLWKGELVPTVKDLDEADMELNVVLSNGVAVVELTEKQVDFLNNEDGLTAAVAFTMADSTVVMSAPEYITHAGFLGITTSGQKQTAGSSSSVTEKASSDSDKATTNDSKDSSEKEDDDDTSKDKKDKDKKDKDQDSGKTPGKNDDTDDDFEWPFDEDDEDEGEAIPGSDAVKKYIAKWIGVDEDEENEKRVDINFYGTTLEIGDKGIALITNTEKTGISIERFYGDFTKYIPSIPTPTPTSTPAE